MPSLTRLAAALFFAAAALYLAEQYKTLYDTPPQREQLFLLLLPVFAFAGWWYTGARIVGKLMLDIFQVLQGFIVGLFLALAIFGTLEVFELGYKLRYKDLGEAILGFFSLTGAHVLRMNDADFLLQVALIVVVIGVVLSLFFRFAERRRLGK